MLIGRDRELQSLQDHFLRISQGTSGPNVAFLTGEAGIGKSALLDAFAASLASSRSPVAVATADCSTPIAGSAIGEMEALAPWAEIITSLATGRSEITRRIRLLIGDLAMAWVHCIPVVGDLIESVVDTARIVKEHHDLHGAPVAAADQGQLFQQYINLLRELSRQMPVVILLDDAHWADASSTNLLFAAARQLTSERVLFVVAYRPDDAASAESDGGHPILHIRNELERYGLAVPIPIPRMSAADIEALLRSRYGRTIGDADFRQWLVHVGSGNALFITQFLETLEEDGLIDGELGTVASEYRRMNPPASVGAVVGERIRRLGTDVRELLQVASVEGEVFTTDVLARLTDTPLLALLRQLRSIEQSSQTIRTLGRQRVYVTETTACEFLHSLVHQMLYDSLGDQERDLLHRAVYDVLLAEIARARQTRSYLRATAMRFAVHARMLHEHVEAAQALCDGARESLEKEFAADEAGRMVALGLDSLKQCAPGDESERRRVAGLRGRMLMLRADIARSGGDRSAALADYTAARDAFQSAEEQTGAIDATTRMAWVLRQDEQTEESRRLTEEVLERSRAIGYQAGEFDGDVALGNLTSHLGDWRSSLEWFRTALAVAEQVDDDRMRGVALMGIGSAEHTLGELDQADRHYHACLELQRARGDRLTEVDVLVNIGLLHSDRGDVDAAVDTNLACLDAYRRMGNRRGEALTRLNVGAMLINAGRWDEAIGYLDDALDCARALDERRMEASVLTNVGMVLVETGDFDGARDAFEQSLAIRRAIDDAEGICIACTHRTILEIEHGDPDRAREWLRTTRRAADRIHVPHFDARIDGIEGELLAVEAARCSGEEAAELRRKALQSLDSCIEQLRRIDHVERRDWERVRDSVALQITDDEASND